MLEQLESGGDKDDKIIVQVNRKVEEWKVRTNYIPVLHDSYLFYLTTYMCYMTAIYST